MTPTQQTTAAISRVVTTPLAPPNPIRRPQENTSLNQKRPCMKTKKTASAPPMDRTETIHSRGSLVMKERYVNPYLDSQKYAATAESTAAPNRSILIIPFSMPSTMKPASRAPRTR